MVSKRRLLSRDRVLDGKIPPLSSSSCRRVLGVTWVARVTRIRRERDSRPERRREGGGASGTEATGPERDRCVARLITYLRLHYCKQCISLYVRSLPFVLSCLPACLPDARLSRPVVHLAVIHREPFHRARKSSSFSSSSSSSSCSSSLSSTASSCESHRLPDVF